MLRQLSAQIAAEQKANMTTALADHDARNAAALANIEKYWGATIRTLTHLIVRCIEVVDGSIKDRSLDNVDQALLAQWTRACQTSFAIVALLRNGFADDAYARWRTIHELNVVADFLRKHGAAVVDRFNAHLAVKNYRVSLEYNRCALGLKYQPIDASEIASLKAAHDAAVAAHEGLNEGDWGWAPKALLGLKSKDWVSFSHLEDAAGLGMWRAHFGMANHNVHAGPHGAYFRLSNPKRKGQPLGIPGASVFGLATPANCCAISLHQITLLLAAPRSETDRRNPTNVAAAFALRSLVDECVAELVKADHEAMTRDWTTE